MKRGKRLIMKSFINKTLKALKDNSERISTIGFIVAAACALIVGIGGVGGNVFEVLSDIIITVILVAMLAAIPFLKAMNKIELIKPVSFIVLGYVFVDLTMSFLSESAMISKYVNAYRVVVAVFAFVAGLALAAALVIFCIAVFTQKENLKPLVGYILVGVWAYLAVVFILMFIACIVYGYGFGSYFNAVYEYLALPAALVFSLFPQVIGEIKAPPEKETKQGETVELAEPKTETTKQ